MRVLVMGGTQFNGLALVHELVRQGHEVTVCNRGRTESDIPDSVGDWSPTAPTTSNSGRCSAAPNGTVCTTCRRTTPKTSTS